MSFPPSRPPRWISHRTSEQPPMPRIFELARTKVGMQHLGRKAVSAGESAFTSEMTGSAGRVALVAVGQEKSPGPTTPSAVIQHRREEGGIVRKPGPVV